jgi:hypothetical protein
VIISSTNLKYLPQGNALFSTFFYEENPPLFLRFLIKNLINIAGFLPLKLLPFIPCNVQCENSKEKGSRFETV